MTITATYSPEDNKLRLYPSERLDAETFARVKEAGFVWAPRQELFVAPKWTPAREDLATELAGEIEPEEMTLAERAALKAERLENLAHKRHAEANAFARRADELSQAFHMGQPILVGHHSERKARRAAAAGMNIHARRIDALELELQLANDGRALDKQAIAEAYARAEQFARRGNQHRERRHRATARARRMIAAARAHAAAQSGRASMAEAALARLQRDIADPVQPERASDLARLIQERDAARTASAALQARADRAERAVHDLAGRFEEMVSRVARAEAAVRKVMAA